MNDKKQLFTQEDVTKLLNTCYEKCLNGIPNVSPGVEDMAKSYLEKYNDPKVACQKMLNAQITKCTTSGFITGFGGFIVMPVAIPANLSSVLYVQMRMIACAAVISGYKLDDDELQTFIYACLAGVGVSGVVKKIGVQLGQKLALSAIKKVPGKILVKINQRVGFRLITKFGSKGILNLGKMIPCAGAVIGGTMDFVETKIIADRAYKWFILNDFNINNSKYEEDLEVIDADFEPVNN